MSKNPAPLTTISPAENPVNRAFNDVMNGHSALVANHSHQQNNYEVALDTPDFKSAVNKIVTDYKAKFLAAPAKADGLMAELYEKSTQPLQTYDGNEQIIALRILSLAKTYAKAQADNAHTNQPAHVPMLRDYIDLVIATDADYDKAKGVHEKKLFNEEVKHYAMTHGIPSAEQYELRHTPTAAEKKETPAIVHHPIKSGTTLFGIASEAPELELVKAQLGKHVSTHDATLALALMIASKNGLHDVDKLSAHDAPLQMPNAENIKFGVLSMTSDLGSLHNHKINYTKEIKGHAVDDLVSLVSSSLPAPSKSR